MDTYRNLCVFCREYHDGADDIQGCNLLMEFGMADDHGDVVLFRGIDHRTDTLQVRGIEGTDGAAPFLCHFQDFIQGYKHFLSS